jgi:hypothetical protein
MRRLGKRRGAEGGSGSKPRQQRCAVRVTYLNNITRGLWKAHGRYLARETATADKGNEVGFNRDRSRIDIAGELRSGPLVEERQYYAAWARRQLVLAPEERPGFKAH